MYSSGKEEKKKKVIVSEDLQKWTLALTAADKNGEAIAFGQGHIYSSRQIDNEWHNLSFGQDHIDSSWQTENLAHNLNFSQGIWMFFKTLLTLDLKSTSYEIQYEVGSSFDVNQ